MSPILITVPRDSNTTTGRPHRGLTQLTGHARCGAIERTLAWHLASEVILPPAGRPGSNIDPEQGLDTGLGAGLGWSQFWSRLRSYTRVDGRLRCRVSSTDRPSCTPVDSDTYP